MTDDRISAGEQPAKRTVKKSTAKKSKATTSKKAAAGKKASKKAAPRPSPPPPPADMPAVEAAPAPAQAPPVGDPITADAVRARGRSEASGPEERQQLRRPSAEAVARRLAATERAVRNDAEADEPVDAPAAAAAPAAATEQVPLSMASDLPIDETVIAEPPAPQAVPPPAAAPRPWLASYPPGVPETYNYPEVPLTRFLDDAARDFPDTIAVEFLGKTMTYRKLHEEVDRFASGLQSLGVVKGDRVGIVLPNCPQHIIAILATLRLGAIVAENNPLYTQAELEHQINDAGCKVLVVLEPVYRKLSHLKGRLPTVRHVIATGIQDYLPAAKTLLYPIKFRNDANAYYKIPDEEGVLSFTDLITGAASTVAQVPIDSRNDVAALLYTGGTTGVSKGVMLTHYNLVANAFQARLWVSDVQAGRENVLCLVPFFHSYGFTACLTFGMLSAATLTLLPRFDRETVLKTIDAQKPTLLPGVPTIYAALGTAPNARKYDLSSIRACLSGAAPLSAETAMIFSELTGAKLREGYGMTETSPITHANPIYGKAKIGSIGLPITDTVCTLVDPDDPSRPAPEGGPGELAISGPQVMAGYWRRSKETAEVLREGWLLTGDIAVMDAEGYFAIVDRKKDVIIAGGYNVYPREVEDVLLSHPKVAKAAVIGVPDSYRGEAVKAFVVLHRGEAANTSELHEFLRERLASYKVPKTYEFRDDLPETIVGKVLRRHLSAEHQARQPHPER